MGTRQQMQLALEVGLADGGGQFAEGEKGEQVLDAAQRSACPARRAGPTAGQRAVRVVAGGQDTKAGPVRVGPLRLGIR